jgi:uncharacterized protein
MMRAAAANGHPRSGPPRERDRRHRKELRERFHALGDFAQASVIAHEVGHHVQNLLGISQKVHALRSRLSSAEANQLSVQLELQADCLAGVWGHHADKARRMVDAEDIEEGLTAASALGDDRIQRRAQGYRDGKIS